MNRLVAFLAIVLFASVGAHAHHSFAIFDADHPRTLDGVVKEFRWINPHSWVFLAVKEEDGRETVWEIEHGPINMLSRQGWTKTTLEPGDHVRIEVHPAHSGQPLGRFIDFEFADAANGGGRADDYTRGTITRVPRPQPVPMTDAVARNFNGIWVNANGGIHFDTATTRDEQMPPLKPEYMARWRQRAADAAAGRSTLDPTAACVSAGFPRFLNMVFPSEILQAEHQLNWYAEFGEATVRIYLDGRTRPPDWQPSYQGFTVGHWEGNTLVTSTSGLRDDTLVDTTGVAHSAELTVTMRMTKLTPDYLEVAVTLEDPVAFERPWSTVKRYARAPADYYVQEYACFAGNRYRIGADGGVEIATEDLDERN